MADDNSGVYCKLSPHEWNPNSVEGRINLSETTYDWSRKRFECEFRGSKMLKIGEFGKMYFLKEKISIGS